MTMDLGKFIIFTKAEKNRIALTENIPIEDQKILLGLQWLGVNVQSSGKKV
jgi:hypothetical protein